MFGVSSKCLQLYGVIRVKEVILSISIVKLQHLHDKNQTIHLAPSQISKKERNFNNYTAQIGNPPGKDVKLAKQEKSECEPCSIGECHCTLRTDAECLVGIVNVPD